jgi:hypothetical protein
MSLLHFSLRHMRKRRQIYEDNVNPSLVVGSAY